MAIRLDLLTQNPQEIDFIRRYWAADESGCFQEKVNDLLPFRNIRRGGGVAEYVRERCRAYDCNQPCHDCGQPIEIKSRSEACRRLQRPARRCGSCEKVLQAQRQAAKAKADEELAARISAYLKQRGPRTLDYRSIKDDEALILMGLEAAISPRLLKGVFSAKDCRALCPMDAMVYIRRLYMAGILIDEPLAAEPGTYLLKEGKLYLKDTEAMYSLVPDSTLGRGKAAFDLITKRALSDAVAIEDLWFDYAAQEVMHYFQVQCRDYNHALLPEELEEVKSTFRCALQTHSIAQLWSLAWKVVRDAASVANRDYYNRSKAAATIPGRVRRYLEKAARQAEFLKPWQRPDNQPAGSLGMVFQELFDIDETTTGAIALRAFSSLEPQSALLPPAAALAEPAARLLSAALAQHLGARVLLQFAELVQTGCDVPNAIRLIFDTNPALGQWLSRQASS